MHLETRTSGTEGWHFLFATDSHLGTPRSYRFRPAINQRWAAIHEQMAQFPADFLLHGGDLTRDGDTHEFEYEQARRDLDRLPFPTFAIAGNMDVGNKWIFQPSCRADRDDRLLNVSQSRLELFAGYFGPLQWTFLHRGVRFTGFYDGVLGSGLPQEKRLWRFLESLSSLPFSPLHVIVTHYWPFWENLHESPWDPRNEEEYLPWYFTMDPASRHRLMECLLGAKASHWFCGHVHTGRPETVVEGIRLLRSPAAGGTSQEAHLWPDAETRNGFSLATVSGDHLEVKFIAGRDQCEEFGAYGPMGHPLPHERDYSKAREHPPLQWDGDSQTK